MSRIDRQWKQDCQARLPLMPASQSIAHTELIHPLRSRRDISLFALDNHLVALSVDRAWLKGSTSQEEDLLQEVNRKSLGNVQLSTITTTLFAKLARMAEVKGSSSIADKAGIVQ